MQSNNEYHYDFSYSVAFDNVGIEQQVVTSDLERNFLQWYEILSDMNVIIQPQTCRSAKLLYRVPVFKKLGLQLLTLCICTRSQINIEQKNNLLQKSRELIYTYLQQLQQVLGKQKQKYINMIIMTIYAIIERTMEENFEIDDQFVIFHIIYWEIKGQLINKQNMQALIRKIFNVQQFHKFMYSNKEELQLKHSKSALKQKLPQPLSFRASITQKMGNQKNILYQSFKELSFSKNFATINEGVQNTQHYDNLEHNERSGGKFNINKFKKKQQYMLPQNNQNIYTDKPRKKYETHTIHTQPNTHLYPHYHPGSNPKKPHTNPYTYPHQPNYQTFRKAKAHEHTQFHSNH